MKIIMIPTKNELYEIPNYEKYELPNKVVDYIKQLEEESKNNYFVHMKKWAKALGNNVKLQDRINKALDLLKTLDEDTLSNMQLTSEIIGHIEYILRGKNNE